MAKQTTYSAKNIEVLEGLEPVRKRPGMYIGSTNEQGLHHLVNEVLDNSIDEVVAGHASEVFFHYKNFVSLHKICSDSLYPGPAIIEKKSAKKPISLY